jgi:glycosyltransferase involved in cell wall biosynthesis
MRIAFVSHPRFGVLPPIGSVEIGTREVARRLAARHLVTVYASAVPGTNDTIDEGVRYRFVGHDGDRVVERVARRLLWYRPAGKGYFASQLNSPLYWIRVARAIRRAGCDVIHIANQTQAIPFLRRFNPDARIVLHMHCEWLIQLDERMLRRRLRHVDAIVGVSEHISGPIRSRFPDLADLCVTVYNGVDVGELPERGRGDGLVRLLHVGRISPEKGHHVLVAALNAVVRDHPEVRMTFVGDESVIPLDWAIAVSSDPDVRDLRRFYGRSYRDQVLELLSPELAERTTFTGRIEYAEIARHYAAADVFVFPSYFESSGVPPIEAMAAGVPVIATPAGGVVESVREGETGVFVPRADAEALAGAINALIEDPDARAAMGAAGHARARDVFSWDRVTAELEGVLEHPAGDGAAQRRRPDLVVAAEL